MEIILINDGSSDDSPKICDEYEKKDDRIIVIHQENKGPSLARNVGIRRATGEYILFLDSDDFLKNNIIERIVDDIKIDDSYDIYSYSYDIVKDGSITKSPKEVYQIREINNINENYKHLLLPPNWAIWNKLYKTSFIIKNELYFFENNFLAEDKEWSIRTFSFTNRILSKGYAIINYRIDNLNSISKKMDLKNIKSSLGVMIKSIEIIDTLKLNSQTYNLCVNKILDAYFIAVIYLRTLKSADKKEAIIILKHNKYLINKSTSVKHKIIKFCITFLGYIVVSNLLWIVKSFKK